jgi:[ribosomal protein S5]-alanine N-acetyltransferase
MSEPDLFTDVPEFPVLRTERLVLRELRDDDVPAAFALFSDPEVMRYVGKPVHADHDETRAHLRRSQEQYPARAGVRWAITPKGDDRLIGSCGHWRLMKEHRRSELGYDLARERWGQGLITEALHAILGFGFGRMGLHSVEAQIDPANARSRRVLERLGFTLDGVLRENFYDGSRYTDTGVYTLLAREHRPPT